MPIDYYKHSTAEVSLDARIGMHTKIWNHAQVREGAFIGERCVISKDCYIDLAVHIGNDVKIQNGVSVYRGVTIENDCFIGPHVAFTNDLRPRSHGEWELVPTLLRKGCSIGAHSTIVCGVTIGEHALIGAGTVVVDNVPPFGLVIGNPGRLVGYVCRKGHRMVSTVEVGYMDKNFHRAFRCPTCQDTLGVTYLYREKETADD